jgi:uridine kinase
MQELGKSDRSPETLANMYARYKKDADADDRLGRVITRDSIERGRTVDKVLERYEKTVKPFPYTPV